MKNSAIMYGDTRYFGIWVQKENEHFWICDANGSDEYFGTTPPSNEQIDRYREQVRQ